MRWNGYIRVDRNVANLNEANFDTLIEAMRGTGLQSDPQPVNVNHDRPNAATPATAYIFQASFDPSEVTVESFKQAMADLFGQPVEDIGDTFVDISYSGGGRETREWTFSLPDGVTDRVVFARFGRGGTQEDSRREALAYLFANAGAWGEIVD